MAITPISTANSVPAGKRAAKVERVREADGETDGDAPIPHKPRHTTEAQPDDSKNHRRETNTAIESRRWPWPCRAQVVQRINAVGNASAGWAAAHLGAAAVQSVLELGLKAACRTHEQVFNWLQRAFQRAERHGT